MLDSEDESTLMHKRDSDDHTWFRSALGVSLPWMFNNFGYYASESDLHDVWLCWPVIHQRKTREQNPRARPAAGGSSSSGAWHRGFPASYDDWDHNQHWGWRRGNDEQWGDDEQWGGDRPKRHRGSRGGKKRGFKQAKPEAAAGASEGNRRPTGIALVTPPPPAPVADPVPPESPSADLMPSESSGDGSVSDGTGSGRRIRRGPCR